MHVLEPFLLDLGLTPDHNKSDIAAEIDAHFTIQRLTEKFLKGDVTIDELEDCLAQFGVEPGEYWGIVDENIDAVIEQGTALEDADTILWLPHV
ncbi:hypothetical protein NIES2135_58090 [Leptolyngbya boryana NIES-2135]|jgi:molybdopterin converting factor small subunit|uniref:Uncharacterized protein n=1 Tax=Leptolyngbya boryana NIES-2135 TaxID=1973484 RepID=A0A1Z4JQE6_LEPBY|nr:hypothetical protein [Leptolyngbya boryana]ULP29985.1 hypothetical protein MCP04_28825 [Leptolyngbya boryana IU 594]BAS54926.1 hypothetical protein LBWT_8260 [Leptolyngbya boryana IAM M-101]BAS61274.1 hypothetical protein LBDG_08260 [Leptolyngbya boryana dg5]BAY58934.1 hypothetical protein NIES2135_58090 [Leptolyngbya boryana NIES-2135]